jgi:WD40 repeat protein
VTEHKENVSAGGNTPEAMRLLKANCFSCHNEKKKKGGLVMTSREALLQGGESGTALKVGIPEQSLLMESLAPGADPHMPPKKQLLPDQIAVLESWIKSGAAWDASALVSPVAPPREVQLAELPASYRPILAMALAPDGSKLAMGCGNEVVVFDVADGNLEQIFRGTAHLDAVQCLAWSADGRHLVTGAFRRVIVWNATSMKVVREIREGLAGRITAVRILPDGNDLVLADGQIGESGIIKVVESDSGKTKASWLAHTDTIFDLAVSRDGALLASAGGDKLVKLWDLKSFQEVAKLEGHVAQVVTLAFDLTGTQLLSGGADQQLKVWDLKTRERINGLGKHTTAVNGVVCGETGIVAITEDGSLFEYTELKANSGSVGSESAKERKVGSAQETLYCVSATANADRIFAGGHEGHLYVWSKDGKVVSKQSLAPIAQVNSKGK